MLRVKVTLKARYEESFLFKFDNQNRKGQLHNIKWPFNRRNPKNYKMTFIQEEISLESKSRGFHLITDVVTKAMPDLKKITKGQLHVFIKHTSAGLTINENADPDVRTDFEDQMNRMVPENAPYVHTMEGPDDMPAHIKSSLMGSSVSIPITNGRLNLGTWQGIYLCEYRNHGGSRKLVLTAFGS